MSSSLTIRISAPLGACQTSHLRGWVSSYVAYLPAFPFEAVGRALVAARSHFFAIPAELACR